MAPKRRDGSKRPAKPAAPRGAKRTDPPQPAAAVTAAPDGAAEHSDAPSPRAAPATPHDSALDRLQALFRTLFRIDTADLDFGLYRLFHLKRSEVESFIEKQLPREVDQAFEIASGAEKAELDARLSSLANRIREDIGPDAIAPDGSANPLYAQANLVKEHEALRLRVQEVSASEGQRAEVFNLLLAFFSRYYDAGDFIARRFFGARTAYAVPYDGSEVHFYWANADQHYVKTGESFPEYVFRVTTLSGDYEVAFRVVEATVPPENTKGDIRFFFPRISEIALDPRARRLSIPFHYRLPTTAEVLRHGAASKGQESILRDAEADMLAAVSDPVLGSALAVRTDDGDGDPPGPSLLARRLTHFTRKNTTDYFVHRNLGAFLRRELEAFVRDQVVHEADLEGSFDAKRRVIRVLRVVAERVITFLAQVEDAQRRLYEKKKFVLQTRYVAALRTLSRILPKRDYESVVAMVVAALKQDERFRFDVRGVLAEAYKRPAYNVFVRDVVFRGMEFHLRYARRFDDKEKLQEYLRGRGKPRVEEGDEVLRGKPTHCYYVQVEPDDLPSSVGVDALYLDTQYLPEAATQVFLESLGKSRGLDAAVDGTIIRGENYQALRLLGPTVSGKVKCLYLDPPYNTGSDGFLYKDRYQHSSWLSMIIDRLRHTRRLLSDDASVYVSIDWNETHRMRLALDAVLGESAFQREIIWNTGDNISGFKSKANNWIRQHDTIYYYALPGCRYVKLWKALEEEKQKPIGWLDFMGPDKDSLYVERWVDGEIVAAPFKDIEVKPLGDVWNDILSFQYSEPRVTESWFFNTQKVENLLRRILQSCTVPGDLVLDPFLGTGTTAAVAHKLGRRWIGIEASDYVDTKILPRLKTVLIGESRAHLSTDVRWQGGGIFKLLTLESYEDALHNTFGVDLGPEHSRRQAAVASAVGDEEYRIRYMLSLPIQDSPATLSLARIQSPFSYTIEVLTDHGPRAQAVDLVETFNLAYGIQVLRRESWVNERDSRGRDPQGRRYLVVRGTVRTGASRVLVIWRDMSGLDPAAERSFLEGRLASAEHFDEGWINGDAGVPGLSSLDALFKRLIEQGE